MAQGTLTCNDSFSEGIGKAYFDLTTTTGHVLKCMLVSDTITIALAATDTSTLNEVTGTNYAADGETLTNAWTRTGGTSTYDSTANHAWTQHASGPSNIKTAVVYDTNVAAVADIVCCIDMTEDGGTTAISLIAGNISITYDVNGLFDIVI